MKRSKDEVAYQTASLLSLCVFLKDVVREVESKQDGVGKVWSIEKRSRKKQGIQLQ